MSEDWIPNGYVRKITLKEKGNRGLFPSSKIIGGIAGYESCTSPRSTLEVRAHHRRRKFQE